MNALVFLYKKVLKVSLKEEINAIRAQKKTNIPVVMTREEVRQTINYIEGSPQLIVKLLKGIRKKDINRYKCKDCNHRWSAKV